ncbi:malto-oligosyltrehalose synthase [Nocardioides sp.]|uniref:malto-oligosyltrehalose synthase n=1 Tax=Nocardioides sp. TaxID=35761 RepID=UPI002728302F|nr:malto-oligosyltrehalose synthase [Nocardioides sp.]MDO9457895.1 malto-oligosyltrehalose synthase [Nocardioides sp.]
MPDPTGPMSPQDPPSPQSPKSPRNTYRLQVRESFDLHEAAGRLTYLRDLGVDWVYLSPLLEAEPGSDHGYDVVRHDRIDPARGGREGFDVFVTEARRLGLGVLVDIVPNHVGIATPSTNAWWWDLLDRGQESRYAEAFDVDWAFGEGRVRVPVVGDGDEGSIERSGDEVRYHDHRFPAGDGYELVSWRAADDRLNWRRFFAVNTLAGIRVEEPWVFDESHVEIARWFAEGLVDGLRVDHPDGLRAPEAYLRDLAGLTGGAYVLVEKILEPGEDLPTSWATAGTTGYDVLGLVDRLLTDPAAEHALPGSDVDYVEMVHDTKRAAADGILSSEVRRVVRELPTLEVTDDVLVDAVAELVACFPVYRSYAPDGLAFLDTALADAQRRRPDLAAAFDAVVPALRDPGQPAAARFEQTSGAVMAKGVEDCAFYRYNRLTSLNEVGGDPGHFSVDVDEFHGAMARRQSDWPTSMTTLSTHDTKRGEDVRARITVLSEVPQQWTEALTRLQAVAPVPSEAFASLLWQAVLGAWEPGDADLRPRLHAYAEKAMREAGDHTTWTAPDEGFESAVHAAVDAAFDDAGARAVLDGLLDTVVAPGWSNALAAKLLALTMPGVPDVYQGSELWEQSLVDPDNRRTVDFDLRAALLADASLDHPARAKLLVTATGLRLRRDRPELFTTYAGVGADGDSAAHVVAFDRGGAIAVATRLPLGLAARGGWGDTTLRLPPGAWRDVLTDWPTDGALAGLLTTYPVALLVKED